MLSAILLSVIMLSEVMLSAIMLSAVMLSAVMLTVIKLNVMAPLVNIVSNSKMTPIHKMPIKLPKIKILSNETSAFCRSSRCDGTNIIHQAEININLSVLDIFLSRIAIT
jgi:hypothetical protein